MIIWIQMLKNKQLLSSLMLVFLFLSRVYPDSDIFFSFVYLPGKDPL